MGCLHLPDISGWYTADPQYSSPTLLLHITSSLISLNKHFLWVMRKTTIMFAIFTIIVFIRFHKFDNISKILTIPMLWIHETNHSPRSFHGHVNVHVQCTVKLQNFPPLFSSQPQEWFMIYDWKWGFGGLPPIIMLQMSFTKSSIIQHNFYINILIKITKMISIFSWV